MRKVLVLKKNFSNYLQFLDDETREEMSRLVENLKGKKIAMVNATEFGGGVAEILHSLIPLMQDMGLEIDWWIMHGENEFFNVTKAFHNCLQGAEACLEQGTIDTFFKYSQLNAKNILNWEYDFVVIHDPQPIGLVTWRKAPEITRWIWRCHIDTSTPNPDYWNFLQRYIQQYDAAIFTMKEFVGEGLDMDRLYFITPPIDPLSHKNIPLEKEEAQRIIDRFGIDSNRPLITQISRFDPWKDPLGVIEVYKIVRKEFPSVQLALVGSMASDDPEGWDYLYMALRRAGEDYDIKVITNFNGVSSLEVNAFQTASDIILQKSIKEGFGLTVSEALWKGTPVIGGNTGGIRLQIEDGVNGYLVDTVEECAERVLTLLRNPALADEMAAEGREKVRKEFLITTNIYRYLKLFNELLQQ